VLALEREFIGSQTEKIQILRALNVPKALSRKGTDRLALLFSFMRLEVAGL